MKQSLDTRTKLLTKNPISLMIELSIPQFSVWWWLGYIT